MKMFFLSTFQSFLHATNFQAHAQILTLEISIVLYAHKKPGIYTCMYTCICHPKISPPPNIKHLPTPLTVKPVLKTMATCSYSETTCIKWPLNRRYFDLYSIHSCQREVSAPFTLECMQTSQRSLFHSETQGFWSILKVSLSYPQISL